MMDISKYSLPERNLTVHAVEHILQIDPEPPKPENPNDYIVKAKETKDLHWFLCYLHWYEPRLNSKIHHFFRREGQYGYTPERFLDYKLNVVVTMLKKIKKYDPEKGANFLTYVYHDVENALLECRRQEKVGSFKSLAEYKQTRNIAWLWKQEDEDTEETLTSFAEDQGCSLKKAKELLTAACQDSRPVAVNDTDEDEEEESEGIFVEPRYERFWEKERREKLCSAVREVFWQLDYWDQTLLEKRNAISMELKESFPMSQRATYEDLAAEFEMSTAGGAERAYHRAVENLTLGMVECGVLHAVQIKRISETTEHKKITEAVYQYCADCDGEWGIFQLNFKERKWRLLQGAPMDRSRLHPFARKVLYYVKDSRWQFCPKDRTFAFELNEMWSKDDGFWSWPG